MTVKLQEDLDYTIGIRRKIIAQMTGDGEEMPSDGSKIRVLNEVLNGMDSAVTTRAKIDLDRDKVAGDKQNAALIAQILATHNSSKPKEVIVYTKREAPMLPKDVPDPKLQLGEIEIYPQDMCFDDIKDSETSTK